VITFRHVDRRFPFLWETSDQPPARWHDDGEGPVHYLADTPDGAWAEFLRHEEITDADELMGVERALWAIEVTEPPARRARLSRAVLTGGLETYPACRRHARRMREAGTEGLRAPSAALLPGGATGYRVEGGLQSARQREGEVIVLFGPRPDLVGWNAAHGRPDPALLDRVRHFPGLN
jgi:hypothetical protein